MLEIVWSNIGLRIESKTTTRTKTHLARNPSRFYLFVPSDSAVASALPIKQIEQLQMNEQKYDITRNSYQKVLIVFAIFENF